MHPSGLPVILSLRSTNTYEERSIGVKDNVGKSNGSDDGSENSYLSARSPPPPPRIQLRPPQTHLKNQLASDALWLFIAVFLICTIERDGIGPAAARLLHLERHLRRRLRLRHRRPQHRRPLRQLLLLRRLVLALSKVVLMAVMVRGRHRGLPIAIDRSVPLPGQELMERMDRDYNGDDADRQRQRDEAKVREDEAGSQAEGGAEKTQDSGAG
ncbi:low affinity potassium transporter [Xylographa bjoerkii]|nr:low affinity potassium transporter [Xylographa bjoerkii]